MRYVSIAVCGGCCRGTICCQVQAQTQEEIFPTSVGKDAGIYFLKLEFDSVQFTKKYEIQTSIAAMAYCSLLLSDDKWRGLEVIILAWFTSFSDSLQTQNSLKIQFICKFHQREEVTINPRRKERDREHGGRWKCYWAHTGEREDLRTLV